ncbi:MAG TPA: RHS repeat-associated core domain-containing protein [Polyangiaceae bacterium]|jgi:RHS repeat-associated protein
MSTIPSFRKRFSGACVLQQTIDISDLFEEVDQFPSGACDPLDAETDPAWSPCTATSRTYRYRVFGGSGQVAQLEHTDQGTSTTAYLHPDHLGSDTAITGSSGEPPETRSYTAFGEAKGFEFSTSPSHVSSSFTGQEQDDDFGLVNMKGRLYDATLGRFITPDPYVTGADAQALNRYAYVENNPVKYVDLSTKGSRCLGLSCLRARNAWICTRKLDCSTHPCR